MSLTVTLSGITHTWPEDIDLLLVSPTGQKVMLMSDVGGGHSLNGVTLTLSDSAAFPLANSTQLVTGTFRPTNIGGGDGFDAPAPASPYASLLSTFNGQAANGAWSLYAMDDGPGDSGSVTGGWALTITTADGAAASPAIEGQEPEDPQPDAKIVPVERTDAGQATLRIEGVPWEKYIIECSEDLVSWTVLGVVSDTKGQGKIFFLDSELGGQKQRFYRAKCHP